MSLWWIRNGRTVSFVTAIGVAIIAGQLIKDELSIRYMVVVDIIAIFMLL